MAKRKTEPKRILIVGGGYVGLYTALGLQKKLRSLEASVTIVDPQPHMTYQPFLPEAAAGSIEPRHVVVPLRQVLKRCTVLTGRITKIDHSAKTATVESLDNRSDELGYDILVCALGSVARVLPIPGLAEQGIGFKTVGEAIYLRNHVLSRLDAASSTQDADTRQRMLTFVVIGGGYAGIEALAELEDMTRYAIKRYYPGIKQEEVRWVVVEAARRIMPEVSEKMGLYTVKCLEERGIKVYLDTLCKSVENGHIVLSDGSEFDADTVIWTAGVKANPVLANTDLPLDQRGRVRCTAELQVEGVADAWAAGDCSAVPDLSKTEADPNATCSPSAQHAVREAKHLVKNILAALRGHTPAPYVHKYAGSVASLGLYKGVSDVYGILRWKGFLAWGMHRAYHLSRMPTFNRKVRIMFDWLGAFAFRREVVSMGQLQDPRAEFDRASRG